MDFIKKKNNLLFLFIFILFSCFIFRPYFFKGLVPFPANLLVSFYSPWRYYDWEGYPNGPPNKPIGFDVLRIFYPFRQLTTDQLKDGQWPLWNPYNFSGNVHLATYQAAVFYPLNFLYFLLPLIDAWSLLVIVQPILAGFFMYLFLKEIKLSQKAAFFGGFVFAFSGWMLAWIEEDLVVEHTALWLPLILYGVEKFWQKESVKTILLLVFAITTSILAGFLQISLYSFLAVFGWIVFRYWCSRKKDSQKLITLGLIFLFSFFISAVHLWPAIEAFFQSPRGLVDAKFLFEEYLMTPQYLLTFLAPDFWGNPGAYNYFGQGFYHEKVIFIGLPAFLFSLLALKLKQKNKEVQFFKWLSLLSLSLGFYPLGWLLYYSRLPLLSVIIPSRIFFLSTFGFSVLSAFGLDFYFKRQVAWKDWQKIFLVITIIFLILWLFVFYQRMIETDEPYKSVSFRNLIPPLGFFIASSLAILFPKIQKRLQLFSQLNAKRLSFLGIISLAAFSSLYFAHKFLYFSERKFVFPEVGVISKLQEIAGVNRVWGYGNGYLEKNINAYYNLFSPEGYDALFSQRYGELLHAQEIDGPLTTQIIRTDANIKYVTEREEVLDNRPRKRLLSLLGVKYLLEAKLGEGKEWNTDLKRFPQEFFRLVWEDEKFKIWEYKNALPRAFLVYDYLVETNKQKIVDYLFDEDFDLAKTIVLEKDPQTTIQSRPPTQSVGVEDPRPKASGPCSHSTIGGGDLEITNYSPNRIEIAVNSPCDSLLFLSDNYYPGWQATVNGQPTEILRADYSFRSLSVPKGKHQVVFSYQPKAFFWGLRTSVLSLFLLAAWLVFWKNKN